MPFSEYRKRKSFWSTLMTVVYVVEVPCENDKGR